MEGSDALLRTVHRKQNTYYDIPGGNGARVIEMEEGRRGFRSWIRMNDGKMINEFSFPDDYLKD